MRVLCLAVGLMGPPVHQDESDPLAAACDRFRNAEAGLQEAIVSEITLRIESSDDRDLLEVLRLRDLARGKLKVEPARELQWYDPEVYARGQRVVRRLVGRSALDYSEKLGSYEPWKNHPLFPVEVEYDFGRNLGARGTLALDAYTRLWNYLEGNVPDADVLLAWLMWRFDHDAGLDVYAEHFQHLYCDLSAACFPGITIYDAFASENGLDMPDVDVIPFAQRILRDRSYRSPIPPDARRDRLYENVKDGFLRYYRYRSMVEVAAHLFLDPEEWVRPSHEGMRENLLYLFAAEQGDPERARKFFQRWKDRDGFMEATLELTRQDPRWRERLEDYARRRVSARWAVAEAAYAVLEEYGFLER